MLGSTLDNIDLEGARQGDEVWRMQDSFGSQVAVASVICARVGAACPACNRAVDEELAPAAPQPRVCNRRVYHRVVM